MKTLTFYISMLCCTVSTFAQTNYYNVTKTFYETGYTYQCDVPASKLVTLYNKSNQLTYVDQVNRYTNEIITTSNSTPDFFADDSWTKAKCHSIVNNAFSPAGKQQVRGYEFMILMYISPDTGKVIEVKFNFVAFNPYATIPVSIYRKIESELKANIWFTPTAEGKKCNYILLWWDQEPKPSMPAGYEGMEVLEHF